jgi:DNA-binding NarL/FixJ family response regulator
VCSHRHPSSRSARLADLAALAPGDRDLRMRHEATAFDLTPREHDVLPLLAARFTNREIAGELFIRDKTASVHVSRILAKLGVRNRAEAAATAHRLGVNAARRDG